MISPESILLSLIKKRREAILKLCKFLDNEKKSGIQTDQEEKLRLVRILNAINAHILDAENLIRSEKKR